MPQRNITLTPELDSWIESEMRSGLYSNVSEFVRDALRNFRLVKSYQDIESERMALRHERAWQEYNSGHYVALETAEDQKAWFQKRREQKIAEYNARKAEL